LNVNSGLKYSQKRRLGMMKSLMKTVFVVLLLMLSGSMLLYGQQAQYAPGEVLVKFNPSIQTVQVQQILTNAGLQQVEQISAVGVYCCTVSGNTTVEDAVAACNADPSVAYAEPNYIYTIDPTVPNDSRFGDLWGMQNSNDADIDAPEAWDVETGDSAVLIGVIDTGVDYNHEDLQSNAWRNPGESGGGKENNGVDDDGNGFVDDVYGWDFASNDKDPMDDNGHGTHVAGTIGAVGNNGKGVVGVNWQVSLMALKFLNSSGSGTTDDAVKAIIYAAENGAHITSNSWGGGGASQALEDAIKFARDRNSLFVAASGNDGKNTDSSPNYPSNYDVENVISVAASDRNDRLASFSNFGVKTVDLAAPGVSILSCRPGDRYQSLQGTSMATPHVSGVAGLILAQNSGLSYRQVLVRLLASVDRKSQFDGDLLTGGRLNAFNALTTNPLVFVVPLSDTDNTSGPYSVNAEAVDDGQIATVTLNYSVNSGATQQVTMQPGTADKYSGGIPGQALGSTIQYFVEAVDNDGNSGRSATLSFKIDDSGCGCGGSFISMSDQGSPFNNFMVFCANICVAKSD
jgi:subtilisin family serine protease